VKSPLGNTFKSDLFFTFIDPRSISSLLCLTGVVSFIQRNTAPKVVHEAINDHHLKAYQWCQNRTILRLLPHFCMKSVWRRARKWFASPDPCWIAANQRPCSENCPSSTWAWWWASSKVWSWPPARRKCKVWLFQKLTANLRYYFNAIIMSSYHYANNLAKLKWL